MKKIREFLSGIPMTVLSGVALLASLLLDHFKIAIPVDPAWLSVTVSGLPLLYLAVERLIYNTGIRKISSALLISIAMIAAIAIGDLFAAGEVAFIMALGEILEDLTTDRAKRGLHKLIALAPTKGRRITEEGEELIDAHEILCGDLLRVLPGETIPVDGVILAGETSVDQSIMTGESLPADKVAGEEVYCGTVNCFGAIDIRATAVGEDSSLEKLIRMVRQAEENKAPTERIADRVASFLVPLAMLIAIVTGLITRDITRAVTVLVVFCPCALVLATPTAIMAAIGQAAKHGVIIKSGEALERMGAVDTIALDKTGTLTRGELTVSATVPLAEGVTEERLLTLAAAVEAGSEHPLGRAIVRCAAAKGLEIPVAGGFLTLAGRGALAELDGRRLFCGNEAFLTEQGVSLPTAAQDTLWGLRKTGGVAILVADSEICLGVIALADTLRPEARSTIEQLKQLRLRPVLMTGDNRRTAGHVAAELGVGEVLSELLPEQKVEGIRGLRDEGRSVAMVGDGVNDAPALKSADVGIAMGCMGSDIAVEAADIALMSDDLSRLSYLKRLSRATVRTIRGGIALSMGINLVAIVLSVLGLLTPTTGALVHNAGSVLVVLIAALLYDRRLDR